MSEERLIQLYGHGLKGWLSGIELILLLFSLSVNILLSIVPPSHRTQSIRSCRNHCQELCQECQTIVCNFENPFSLGRLDLGLHVFADILYLRWNLSAGLPGQIKLYSTFYSETATSQKRQQKLQFDYKFCDCCVFRKVRVMSVWGMQLLLPPIYWFICNLDNDRAALCSCSAL